MKYRGEELSTEGSQLEVSSNFFLAGLNQLRYSPSSLVASIDALRFWWSEASPLMIERQESS